MCLAFEEDTTRDCCWALIQPGIYGLPDKRIFLAGYPAGSVFLAESTVGCDISFGVLLDVTV